MKIAVFAAADTWHFEDLQRAAGDQQELISCDFKGLASRLGSHGQCSFHAGSVCLDSVNAILLRTMPAGSLEQTVLRMDILGSLARRGKRIVNAPKTIEMAVDKYLTLARMAERRIPVPATIACQSREQAMQGFDQLGQDVVVKPLFGSLGRNIERVQSAEAAELLFERKETAGDVIYLQEYIEHGDSDLRLLVIGQKVLGMKRTRPGHWLTNIHCGATGTVYQPSPCEKKLALKAARAVGAEIAGVDVMVDSRTDRPVVIEVNAAPGWRTISQVHDIDVARLVLDHVVNLPSL